MKYRSIFRIYSVQNLQKTFGNNIETMKSHIPLKGRFARAALLTLLACGLSAAAANAAQVVTVPLAGKEFGNGVNAHGESTGQLNASKAYFYRIVGSCQGTGPLAEAIPPGTKLSQLLNDISAGAAANLAGTKENPAGTLPFGVLNKTVSGQKDGLSFTMTFSLYVSGTGKVTFDVKDVSVTGFGWPIPGTVLLEDGAKAIVGVAPTIQMAKLAQNVSESAGQVLVEVKRTGNLNVAARVNYATVEGTATKAHFKPTSGTLIFDAGQTSKKIKVLIKNNLLKDGARKFKVKLTKPVTAVLGDATITTVTINSDE